jgi:hypothetical protein
MYDAWAAFEPGQNTYFLGKELYGFQTPFEGILVPQDSNSRISNQNEALSFAAYRLIKHRFSIAPGAFFIYDRADSIMIANGYDINFTSTDYILDGPAALGNYIAENMIAYGFQDGSNEIANHNYQYYEPFNPPIEVELPGNPNMIDPNRWQAIALSNSIDQSGNPVGTSPPNLGPEWGNVNSFSLNPNDITIHFRDGFPYQVYHDPSPPPYLDTLTQTGLEDFFKWNFSMVSVWQSHLDPNDSEIWDISPNSMGNILSYPESWSDYDNFYDFFNGGDTGEGYTTNPVTGLPYSPQLVKRGDYARILAEFWADGIDSETPPGHWFEIYNTVSEHPLFERKWKGVGPELSELEYDVKAYFTLGAAMHDAAVSAWSVKGWYDYPRPVSVIRYMTDRGQSSDPLLPNYHPAGIPLIPGYIELVETGDSLAGSMNEHLHKIKLYTWRGPDYVSNPETDIAGVGWILAENWWPYQKPNFVTPPFSGYVSGHSTYSAAAAEVLEFITGSPFFPGGIGEFEAPMNDFLEFEQGPSETVILQWATYKDASDQCSLSRIWGGIHPPIDDIPGRKIGKLVGESSCQKADSILHVILPQPTNFYVNHTMINESLTGQQLQIYIEFNTTMNPSVEPIINFPMDTILGNGITYLSSNWLNSTLFLVNYTILDDQHEFLNPLLRLSNCTSLSGVDAFPNLTDSIFVFDTKKPELLSVSGNLATINQHHDGELLTIDFLFSEPINQQLFNVNLQPLLMDEFELTFNSSQWLSPQHVETSWLINLIEPTLDSLTIELDNIIDLNGNLAENLQTNLTILIDSESPAITSSSPNSMLINETYLGSSTLEVEISFSKAMNTEFLPYAWFEDAGVEAMGIEQNLGSCQWLTNNNLLLKFNILPGNEYPLLQLYLDSIMDNSGNYITNLIVPTEIQLDTRKPEVINLIPSTYNIDLSNYINQDFSVTVSFDETMSTTSIPLLAVLQNEMPYSGISYNPFGSYWVNPLTFHASFNLGDVEQNSSEIYFSVAFARDAFLNTQNLYSDTALISVQYNPNHVGLEDTGTLSAVTLYPNPVSNHNKLFIQSPQPMTSLTILDASGKVIFSQPLNNILMFSFDTQTLSPGLYFFNLHYENNQSNHKIIIHE